MTNQDNKETLVEKTSEPARPQCFEQNTCPSSGYSNASKKAKACKRNNAPTIIAILVLALLVIAGLGSCGSRASRGGSISVGDTVAIIKLSGTIQYDGSECSPEGLKSLLDEAEANDNVKAVVLRVDSGGGVATAGEEMTTYLKGFSKPVVVSSASMNASAAYEVSSQADYIYVAATTEIGAIGTARQFVDYSDLMDMLGIDMDVIVSADSKDSTYGLRELTEEERQHYQEMIDECNSVFISNVAEGRGVSNEKATEWATGLTWTGMSAVEMGIADEIGTVEDACNKAAELGGCSQNYTTSSLYIETYGFNGLLDILASSSSAGSLLPDGGTIAMKELKNDASIVQ